MKIFILYCLLSCLFSCFVGFVVTLFILLMKGEFNKKHQFKFSEQELMELTSIQI